MSNIDESYTDPVLASLYDAMNPWGPSDEFYYRLATERGGRVLDVGCGTGALACRLAECGLEVWGVDPAPSMLEVARGRAAAERVTWIQGDARYLGLGVQFDTILMASHAFQVFLADDDIRAILAMAAGHLKQDGVLVFETRNPAGNPWEGWRRDSFVRKLEHPEYGPVEAHYEASETEEPGVITLATHFIFLDRGEERVTYSRLRFVDRDHLEELISSVGLTVDRWLGDWSGNEFTEDSVEIIPVARRSRAGS
jgi:ubiquinone/menaquinone biosynthesis C-methylase UbiE